MRTLHAIANLIALVVLVGIPLVLLFACGGSLYCAEQMPPVVLLIFGAVPAACFLLAALASVLSWSGRLSYRYLLPAALMAAIASFAMWALAALAYVRVLYPPLENTPYIFAALANIVVLWVPFTSLWNAILLARALSRMVHNSANAA